MLLLPFAHAATLPVGTTYASIAAAVAVAKDGDTIQVAAGTWAEAVDFAGRDVSLIGAGSALTFIAPPANKDALTLDNRESVRISGMSIIPSGGRGIYVASAELTASDIVIDGGGSSVARGGGISLDDAVVQLDDVTLTGNVGAMGGHLYLTGASELSATNLTMTDGTATYGGDIYADEGSTLRLTDTTAVSGGFALEGVTFEGSGLTVEDATFQLSDYTQLSISGGSLSGAGSRGFDVAEGSVVSLADFSVTDCAGGVELRDSATAEFSQVTFAGNVAAEDGGAIWAQDGSTIACDECAFDGNSATDGGAVLLATGTSMTDEGGAWTDNEADGSGGAVRLEGTAEASFSGSVFSSNTAEQDGGAISGGDLELSDVQLISNVATRGDGGAIDTDGDLEMDGGVVESNRARVGDGGAIAGKGDADLSDVRFTDNEAGGDGGAIWSDGELSIWEGTFFRNVADGDGGAVWAAELVFARSYVHGNIATNGGAIAAESATLTNLRITDNVASGNGGGAWLAGTTQLDVVNNTFAGNDASDQGGHLYSTGPLSLVNNIFYEAIDGGAAYGVATGSDRYYNLLWDNAGGDWVGWGSVTGNLAEDPELVAYTADGDETDDELFLAMSSPCIDGGSPAIFDVDGTRSDIGAFGGPDADVSDEDRDGFYDNVDCDDADAAIHPAATDTPYDAIDQDCDGADVDDLDGDGFGASVVGGNDCDDTLASVYPGAKEIWYDGIDSDCSGGSDYDQDGDLHDADEWGGDDCDDLDRAIHGSTSEVWYDGIDQDCDGRSDYDRDRDGHDSTRFYGDDCDDYDASAHPGGNEIPYDGIDGDCSGADLVDVDEDGWIAEEAGGTDCNDSHATVYPGAVEDPTDGFDTDCDGFSEWDRDGDGWDDVVYGGGDCEDFDAEINPGMTETWYDGIDQDCDGRDDDMDADGYALGEDCDDTDPGVHPGAMEKLDGIDNDCDGFTELDDPDQDGLTTIAEWVLGTDPHDADTDGDTLGDGDEIAAGPDRDGDWTIDALDTDDDGDGIPTRDEQTTDLDGDGAPDTDPDNDGIINAHDDDSDGDGHSDLDEGADDDDGDGAPDYLDYLGVFVGGGCGGGTWAGIFLPFVWLVRLFTPNAHAVDAHGFNLYGTSGDATAYNRIGTPVAGRAGSWDAAMVFDFADDPLAETFPWGREPVIDALGTVNVAGGYSFGGLRIDAVMPVHLTSDQAGTGLAPGDARLGVLVPAWKQSGLRPSVGVQASIFAPTGDETRYLGTTGPRAAAVALASYEFGQMGLIAMLGGQFGLDERERNLDGGFGPMLGVGAAYRITDALSTSVEVVSQTDLAAVPVEATLSARYRLSGGAWATVGGGAGVGEGVGAARWRAVAGVGWSYRKPEPVAALAIDPHADRDGDGIPDVSDECKDQAETFDGFSDEDGCPELDGDEDGVTFERDACPSEPIRPEQDPRYSDGCPKVAEFAGDRIVITEAVFFREARAELLPSAEPILAAVATIMQDHPEIGYFLVEGHTNTNGGDTYNLRLSDARAFAVMQWLTTHGVAPGRLLSKGFGESRLLVPDSHPDSEAINRRVEFRVVAIDDLPTDARRIEVPEDVR